MVFSCYRKTLTFYKKDTFETRERYKESLKNAVNAVDSKNLEVIASANAIDILKTILKTWKKTHYKELKTKEKINN